MTDKEKIKIANIARHIIGKTSTFRSVRTVDISNAKLRELCAELYCHIDSIVEVLDKAEIVMFFGLVFFVKIESGTSTGVKRHGIILQRNMTQR